MALSTKESISSLNVVKILPFFRSSAMESRKVANSRTGKALVAAKSVAKAESEVNINDAFMLLIHEGRRETRRAGSPKLYRNVAAACSNP